MAVVDLVDCTPASAPPESGPPEWEALRSTCTEG